MINISKKNIVLIVVVVVLVVVGVYFGVINKQNKGYSVVYLSTGEVYVGKLCTFFGLTLTDGYIFQATKDATDPTKNTFQLNPIKEALWAPKKIHLVKDNVVFYGPLLPTSKIAETLAAQAK